MKLGVGLACRKYPGSQVMQIIPLCNTEYKCVISCELADENQGKNSFTINHLPNSISNNSVEEPTGKKQLPSLLP